jgi:hypothetical protein
MFELLVIALFCWIFFGAIKLTFKVAWGVAKVAAVILFILALPSLIGCLLYASGIILLMPVVLIGLAWGILKACL